MGQINITILVDFSKVKQVEGEIINPAECIFMFDDQEYDYYDFSKGIADLGTYVFPGDLLIWTILPVPTSLVYSPGISRIVDSSVVGPLFNNNENIAPLVYQKNKIACAAISDNLLPSTEEQYYKYRIYIKNEKSDDEYWWDPFIEVRNKDLD